VPSAHALAEASSKEHILLQQPIGPGQRRTFQTSLVPGRYRARVIAENGARVLDVVAGSRATTITLGEAGDASREAGPSPTVTLVNDEKKRRIFVIEDVQWTDDAGRPAHLFNLPEFRDLFAAEHQTNLEELPLTLPSGGEPVPVCRWDTIREPASPLI
jgi:hypothetical protein